MQSCWYQAKRLDLSNDELIGLFQLHLPVIEAYFEAQEGDMELSRELLTRIP